MKNQNNNGFHKSLKYGKQETVTTIFNTKLQDICNKNINNKATKVKSFHHSIKNKKM